MFAAAENVYRLVRGRAFVLPRAAPGKVAALSQNFVVFESSRAEHGSVAVLGGAARSQPENPPSTKVTKTLVLLDAAARRRLLEVPATPLFALTSAGIFACMEGPRLVVRAFECSGRIFANPLTGMVRARVPNANVEVEPVPASS